MLQRMRIARYSSRVLYRILGGGSLWGTATVSCMSMRLYKFCFEYETIQIFNFSGWEELRLGGGGIPGPTPPLYETLNSVPHVSVSSPISDGEGG